MGIAPCGGLMIWLLPLVMLYFLCAGQIRKCLCILPIIRMWGTLPLSSPYAFGFRYVYAIYLACPIAIPLFLLPNSREGAES